MRWRSKRSGPTTVLFALFFPGPGTAILLAQVPQPEPTPAPAAAGPVVVSLAYTADGPVEPEEIARLVEIREGQPLTEKLTAATIRNLFATGRFSDVQIEADSTEGGVAVVVRLTRSYQVRPIRFPGSKGFARDDLLRTLPFAEGDVYNAGDVEEGALALAHRCQGEGFLSCRVTSEVRLDRETFRAAVEYRFDEGTPARVAPPFFDGDTKPYTPEELAKHAKLKPGARYREAKAQKDATRITEFLHDESRLRATVELIAAQPTDDGRIMPVYRISVGPKVEFETTGISAKKVRKQLHEALEGGVLDEDVFLQYVESKRRELQEKGFYRARVDYTLTPTADDYLVRLTVDPGPHLEVEEVHIAGNDSVPEKTLRKLILTHTRGLPLISPGHLVDDVLDEDRSAILGYYQTHGWIGAKVEKPAVTEGSKPNRLVVDFNVKEGPRAIVRSRKIEGNEHTPDAELERRLRLKEGEPYNPALVREDVGDLQATLHDRGWSEAVVRAEPKLSDDRQSVDVVYHIEEGMRSFFGRTIIRGNARTTIASVRRLVTFQQGRPFSDTELLNTQRNLSRIGVFRRVEVRPQPADPQTAARNVDIELQEGKPLSLLYGIGYQYTPDAPSYASDPYLVGGVSYNNLFGKMLSAGMEGQISISGRYRLQISYRDPYLLNRDLTYTASFFATREAVQEVDIDRLGLVNEVSHYFTPHLRGALRLEYQRIRPVNPEDLSYIEANDFPRYAQPIEEATFGPNVFYDRRDDIIDPHRGYYTSVLLRYAFPVLSAEARFFKFTTQAAGFLPLGRSVFAASARLGGIFPYGPPDIQIPFAERFFAGGQSTGRGFQQDLLGIPGQTVDYDTRATIHTGDGTGSCAPTFPNATLYDCNAGPHPVGGNGFFAANVEYRFPIFGALEGAIFYDLAQVWASFSDVNFRFEGDDGLRQTAGVGLRYMTPIGPLRAEYGQPLRPKTIPYDITTKDDQGNRVVLGNGTVKEKGRFIISIGYPF